MTTTTQEHEIFRPDPDEGRGERRYDRTEAWLLAAFAVALLVAYARFIA